MALKYNQGEMNHKSFPNIVNIQRRQVLPERQGSLIYEHSTSGRTFYGPPSFMNNHEDQG